MQVLFFFENLGRWSLGQQYAPKAIGQLARRRGDLKGRKRGQRSRSGPVMTWNFVRGHASGDQGNGTPGNGTPGNWTLVAPRSLRPCWLSLTSASISRRSGCSHPGHPWPRFAVGAQNNNGQRSPRRDREAARTANHQTARHFAIFSV